MSGNIRHVTRNEWIGAPPVDKEGHIERSAEMPEEVYLQIEQDIARGTGEGMIFLDNQRRLDWFLDR